MWLVVVECVHEVSTHVVSCGCTSQYCPITSVCTGTDSNGVVMGGNFSQFTSCTILNGSLAISDSSFTGWALNRIHRIYSLVSFPL